MTDLNRNSHHAVRWSIHRWMKWSLSVSAVVVLAGLFVTPLRAEEPSSDWRALVSPDNSLAFMFLRGDERVFSVSLGGWGPNWGWVGFGSNEKASGDELVLTAPFEVNKAQGQVILVKQRVWKSADREISIHYELSADKDVPLTMLIAGITFDEKFQDGDILFKHRDGTEGTLPLTIGGPGAQPETGTLVFRSKAIGRVHGDDRPAAADRLSRRSPHPTGRGHVQGREEIGHHHLSPARRGEPAGEAIGYRPVVQSAAG